MKRIGLLLLTACSGSVAPPAPAECDVDADTMPPPPFDAGIDATLDAGSPPIDATLYDVVGLDVAVHDAPPDVITGATPQKPRVFVYGNSMVYGSFSSDPATKGFPPILRDALGPDWEASAWLGRSGYTASMLYFAAPHDLPTFLNADRTRNVLVFWEGINDVRLGNAFACDAYEGFTRARVAEGWTVVLLTMLATSVYRDGGTGSAPWADFNTCVRNGWVTWGAAALVDVAADPQLQNPYGPEFHTDWIHLSDLGYARVAADVAPVVRSLYVKP